MPTKEPDIHVSEWRKWHKREDVFSTDWAWEKHHRFSYLGVYVFAHFPSQPGTDQNPPHVQQEVVYIGVTLSLASRPRTRHEVLKKYAAKFSDPAYERLYLAVYSLDQVFHLTDPIAAFIRHVERKFLWEYAAKHDHLPDFNTT